MIELVIETRRRDLGGFEVGRVLPYAKRKMVGPFIFFDRLGPATFAPHIPRSTDVRPHPHIGLSTITYLFAGEITHRDSLGFEQVIRPGEINWMTAGRGITHSERFEGLRERGGAIDGIQAWVALPHADEETDPAFDHYAATELPVIKAPGVSGRLIAGAAYGERSTVKTHSPLFYAHATLAPGARLELPADHPERAVYVVEGEIEAEGKAFSATQMLVFAAGDAPSVKALTAATVMLLGGTPLGPRFIWWNLVSSRRERILNAMADWKAQRMKLPVNDEREFTPLPADPPPGELP
jgi:redox-sensitive bicupin YhaK (pirin superfamily)